MNSAPTSSDAVPTARPRLPVTLHIAADHHPVEDVHRRKQRRRSVALVVMSHRAGASLLHRQARLGPVERLDLALLVDRQDDGVRRRIDVKPDHVTQFVDEDGVVGQLELPHPMRLEPMGAPDALDRRNADAGCFRHRRACPMRRFGQRPLHGQRHNALGDSGIEFRDARGPCLVTQQPFKALRREAFLPAPDAGLGLARLLHDRVRAEPFSAQQNDPRSPSMLLGRVTIADQRAEPIKVGRRTSG